MPSTWKWDRRHSCSDAQTLKALVEDEYRVKSGKFTACSPKIEADDDLLGY